jgi:hypothetical protein
MGARLPLVAVKSKFGKFLNEELGILDFGHYRQGRGFANGFAQCKFWILD